MLVSSRALLCIMTDVNCPPQASTAKPLGMSKAFVSYDTIG